MILANYAQQNRNCVREWGQGFTNPLGQFRPCLFQSFYTPDTLLTGLDKSAFNNGYNTHYAWALSPKSGGIGSTLNIVGTGTLSVSALAVKLATADLTGTGTLAALGSLIVQAVAALSGSGTVNSANLQAFLAAVANLSGSGTITSAQLTGLGAIIAALIGSGTATGSTLTGTGELDGDLTVTGTGLSTANVGQAVWSALAAANNSTGTMGEKLNAAGGGSSPTDIANQVWGTLIESGLDAQEILRVLVSVAAGDATGLESPTPVFKDLAGTKSRVSATYAAGRRTITAIDGT